MSTPPFIHGPALPPAPVIDEPHPAGSKVAVAGYSLTVWEGDDGYEAFPCEVPGEARRALALALCPEMFAAPLAHGRAPGVPMPVVEVQSCHACPAFAAHSYATTGRCRLAGVEVDAGSLAPAGCPLRSGPVALRLIDRGRP